MSEGERIRALRKSMGLTMAQFCAPLGIKGNALSMAELGNNAVSESLRTAICREYGVRREWLLNGTGEMLEPRSVRDDIERLLRDIPTSDGRFRANLISVLARLDPEEWQLLETMARKLAEGLAPSAPEPKAAHEMTPDEMHDELDRQITAQRQSEGGERSGSGVGASNTA